MSSSKKKVKPSVGRSIRLSPRPDGLRLRDTNVLYTPSEMAWVMKRLGNQERILKECRENPVKLLNQVDLMLREQGNSHAAAGRSAEAKFHFQLAIYISNLKKA